MTYHELELKFLQVRDYLTDDVNELLDFTKNAYVHNEISICEYRNLVRELESMGAKYPDLFNVDSYIN